MSLTVLEGITWDHDRGILPLLETTSRFEKLHPDIRIHWQCRSLKEFGDYPVEKLAEKFDLLLIDHPFSGEAYKHNILVDFNHFLSPDQMAVRKDQELGRTHECYNYEGSQMALSVDIAAMVSVYRKDLLEKEGVPLPDSLDEILKLARRSGRVAAPMGPTDIWCMFLSLGGAKFGDDFITEHGIRQEDMVWVLEQIYRICDAVLPESIDWNPIQIMDRMAEEDWIFYAPFCFGYVNYAWRNLKKPLHFVNTPLWDTAKTACVLGGVGIAVSAGSRHVEKAVQYAEYVTRPEVQEKEYFLSGGQPGQRNAWESDCNNLVTNGFFKNTRATIDHAYLRPRFPGWNVFQEKCGALIHAGVKSMADPCKMAEEIQSAFQEHIG